MGSAPLAFIDTETTGLHPELHEIWEVGLIIRPSVDEDGKGLPEREYLWQLPVDLSTADPFALDIGRFHERRARVAEFAGEGISSTDGSLPAEMLVVPHELVQAWGQRFVALTRGAHLVGAVVSFDADRLDRLLRRYGLCPLWHYHLVDVEALAAGKLGIEPPWDSGALSNTAGVPLPADEDRHTALGDARWARDIYDAVLGS